MIDNHTHNTANALLGARPNSGQRAYSQITPPQPLHTTHGKIRLSHERTVEKWVRRLHVALAVIETPSGCHRQRTRAHRAFCRLYGWPHWALILVLSPWRYEFDSNNDFIVRALERFIADVTPPDRRRSTLNSCILERGYIGRSKLPEPGMRYAMLVMLICPCESHGLPSDARANVCQDPSVLI